MTARKKGGELLPPIPRVLRLPAGDVAVIRQSGLQAKGTAGIFRWGERSIVLDSDLGRTAAWLTLYHEWIHAVLADAGVTKLTKQMEEDVANAIASALVYGKRQL